MWAVWVFLAMNLFMHPSTAYQASQVTLLRRLVGHAEQLKDLLLAVHLDRFSLHASGAHCKINSFTKAYPQVARQGAKEGTRTDFVFVKGESSIERDLPHLLIEEVASCFVRFSISADRQRRLQAKKGERPVKYSKPQ